MKNEYQYLVTYCYNGGIGSAHMTTGKKIKSFEDIKKMKRHIQKNTDIGQLTIMSYTLVRKSERKRKFIK